MCALPQALLKILSGLLLGLITFNLPGLLLAAASPPQWGRTVQRIRLECDARLSLEQFAGRITQQVGEPLDRGKVAQSLRNLFATGRFAELRADAEPLGDGIELVFVARAVYFIGLVQVEGAPEAIEPRSLVTASRLRLAEPIDEADLAAARERLMAMLAENGYYRAEISHRLVPNPDTQVADIVYSIVAGPPATLAGVEFVGQPVYSPERLLKVAGWRPGIHLVSSRLERGLFRVHRFHSKEGRLLATVNVRGRVFDPQQQTEKLVVQVLSGPLVRVRIEGAGVSKSKARELLPFYTEGVVDETARERGRQNLEDHFERLSYHAVSVKVEQAGPYDSGTLDITYKVTLGERGEFVGYEFRGNKEVTSAELARLLTVHPKDFFRERGVFSREMLRADIRAMKALCESHGFLEAQITPHVDNHHENRRGRLHVVFEVTEGPRTRVGRLTLHGVDAETQKGLWPLLLTKPGQPYSPSRAQSDRDLIAGHLADRGYPHATVTWGASLPAQDVDVEFRVEPGVQERIARLVLLGNEFTRPGTIRRELTLQGGEPLNQSDVLESQRRLYDLGMFSQVQIATQDPLGAEAQRTVLVSVEEARRWTVGYGGGIEVQRLGSARPEGEVKASPRLSFELTRLNVGGRAQTLTLRGRLSTLEKGGALSYLVPRFPTRRDLALRLNALVDRSRDVLTFTAEREEASISLEKHYSAAALVQARFSFRRVLVDSETLRISPEEIPLLSRPARVAMLGISYANDHRDNPADATDGSYSLADAGVSWTKFGSQSNFVRVSGQNATYHQLGPHLIVARHTRFAVESTLGQVGPRGQIPLPERFFMGGSESHRGFSINQAGPRDAVTGFPVGGNALFMNSLELRVPFAENRLGFVMFHDAGNVFSTFRRLRLLKVAQNSPTDFDYTVHAVGMGVRYRTPVGPVRFDAAYDFNPPRFQVVLPGGMEVRRLAHFQFFLSIGQSF